MIYAEYDSPVGKLFLASNGIGLTGLGFGTAPGETGWDPVLEKAVLWLEDYFRGNVREPDVPLVPEGTTFQQRVWQLLPEIPCGQTVSYGDLARKLGNIRSAQAVGQAVGKNPIAILIPCHRVVGAKGQLTGYAWGVEIKKRLLNLEAGGE